MRIRARLFLAFFILVGIAVWALLDTFKSELAPALRQSSEETLVDTANLLAELAANDLRTGNIGNGALANAVERFSQRRFDADIWGIRKTAPNHRIYVTDATGKVLYDSENLAVGQDYSRWRDVNLTLQGRYGARSSRDSQHPDKTSVMYVAAPILRQGQIIGVLSVGKPTRSLQPFIERSSRKLTLAGVVVVRVALLLALSIIHHPHGIDRDFGQLGLNRRRANGSAAAGLRIARSVFERGRSLGVIFQLGADGFGLFGEL